MASWLVSVPRLVSFSFMWRCERWRMQKKVVDTASATRMKSMQRTESSRNWPDSTLVSFTTGIWVRLPLWRTNTERTCCQNSKLCFSDFLYMDAVPPCQERFFYFHLEACFDFQIQNIWFHSLDIPDSHLIICIQAQSAPITNLCPVLSLV